MPESMSAGYIESTNQAKLITDPTVLRPQVRSQRHHVSCQAISLLQFVPEDRESQDAGRDNADEERSCQIHV